MTPASKLLIFIIFGIFIYAIYVPAGTTTSSQRSTRTASMSEAPVKCGPYFLYIHPNYWKIPARRRRALSYKTYVVTRTPPDANVTEIRQLWAYGYRQRTISNSVVLEKAMTRPRTDLRPAQWGEMTLGDYIGDHYCKPYKPYKLKCYYTTHDCTNIDSLSKTP